jgi:hypothetical protein
MNRKVLLSIASVFIALSCQAVSLNWSGNGATAQLLDTTGGSLTVGAASETASIAVYYILASDYAAVSGITDKTTVSGTYAKATAIGQTSTSTAAAGRFGASSAIIDSSAGVDYYARVYATVDGGQYYMDLKNGGTTAYWTTTVNGDNTVTEVLGWNAAPYGGSIGVAGDFNKWIAVPEPTSMALFGLGAAVLGLRRRFQKKA